MIPTIATAPVATTPAPPPPNPALEKLLELDDELSAMIHRKKELERNLAALESQIYNVEGRYLEQTPLGNVIRGFEDFIMPASSSQMRQQVNVFGAAYPTANESDRAFSQSSATYRKSLQLVKELEMAASPYYQKGDKMVKKKKKQRASSASEYEG
jgi:chromatin modification-related protein EAF6